MQINCPRCGLVKTRTRVHCADCHRNVKASFKRRKAPPVHDNTAWEQIRRLHKTGCNWVKTRGHRIDPHKLFQNILRPLYEGGKTEQLLRARGKARFAKIRWRSAYKLSGRLPGSFESGRNKR